MLNAGGKTFCPWEKKVVRKRLVVFEGVGSSSKAFGRGEAGGFGEGD